jgi:hypothetical protein
MDESRFYFKELRYVFLSKEYETSDPSVGVVKNKQGEMFKS